MKVAMLQQNFLVGDVEGNAGKIYKAYQYAVKNGADLVVSSELSILGYPPRDLLEQRGFIDRGLETINKLASKIGRVGLIVGFAEPNNKYPGKALFNSAAFLFRGKIHQIRRKTLLSTYDVFDESRYFEPYIKDQEPILYKGKKTGLLVCEDIWNGIEAPEIHPVREFSFSNGAGKQYAYNPLVRLFKHKPDFLIVINGSPYWWGKGEVRFSLVKNIAQKYRIPVFYINQVGGNDELVFDGRSFALNSLGECIGVARPFHEKTVIIDLKNQKPASYSLDKENFSDLEAALVLGVKDYIKKTKAFKKGSVIGLSGGIDSALTAYIATRALGKEKVLTVSMPSLYSSRDGIEDARKLARNLGVKFRIIPIKEIFSSFRKSLKPTISWYDPPTVTEENIQARIRGVILMAIANREKRIVLGTGNKSELAVGYATLYGDMASGLGTISDLPKTLVYNLAKYINRKKEIIPRRILEKPPSAELRPDQKDTDSLPPYEVLDPILSLYIEERKDAKEIIKKGFNPALVNRVLAMVNRNEFKRRQMAPGIKVTSKAFGMGRRMPIAARIPTNF